MVAVRLRRAVMRRKEAGVAVIKRKTKKSYKCKESLVKTFGDQRKCLWHKLSVNGNLLGSAALSPFVASLSNHLFPSGYERTQQPKRGIGKPDCTSLHALTAAAIILPGLFQPAAQAADDEVDFQYSHYQEGRRNIYNTEGLKGLSPIEVDSIHGGAKIKLTDRIKFAFNYTQDTWGGATPITTAPFAAIGNHISKSGASPFFEEPVRFDAKLNPLVRGLSGALIKNSQLVHTLSTASPETRKQGDFKLGYEWDEAELDIGGGISVENDYESHFGNINGRWDFNNKQTSVNLGLSYTNSDTAAIPDHDARSYSSATAYFDQIERVETADGNLIKTILHGNRQDWSTTLGLTQIVNKDALLELGISYTRSTGFLENPYKYVTVFFIEPEKAPDSLGNVTAKTRAFLEQRPDERNQFTWNVGYKQFVESLDAALHVDYHFFHDDWGINAHTFEADWVQPVGNDWTFTPRIRYYSQEAADFYQPFYFSFNEFDERDGFANLKFLPAAHFSSDQRLSGYGTLSGGVTVSKQFAKGISLDTGFEYYTHQGGLKLGGGGEGEYADFDYWVANAALKVNLSALGQSLNSMGNDPSHHAAHSGNAPAGVMFAHTLDKAGDMMIGYRYMYNNQAGDMLHGDKPVNDPLVYNNACFSGGGSGRLNQCFTTPTEMTMHMHMLDLMYAPTDWLTLMLMPQFVDMDMSMRASRTSRDVNIGNAGGHIDHHISSGHNVGGVGDTGMYGLFKLFDNPNHHANLGLGVSAPTGDVGIQLRRNHKLDGGLIHYGMQLGSGTWDFKPSLTYTGQMERWSWGTQLSGTKRLEGRNKSGFALGDLFQATAWGGYGLTPWLSATVRGVYTWQGRIKGQYSRDKIDFNNPSENCPKESFQSDDGEGNIFFDEESFNACIQDVEIQNQALINEQDVVHRSNPADFPGNYGGRYVDVGLGLSATVPSGSLAGNKLSFEWLQPVYTDVNGYQLDRDGALSFTWSYGF
jgi:Protein of unknown function (DUF3570)